MTDRDGWVPVAPDGRVWWSYVCDSEHAVWLLLIDRGPAASLSTLRSAGWRVVPCGVKRERKRHE